jgi:hypothetical protein
MYSSSLTRLNKDLMSRILTLEMKRILSRPYQCCLYHTFITCVRFYAPPFVSYIYYFMLYIFLFFRNIHIHYVYYCLQTNVYFQMRSLKRALNKYNGHKSRLLGSTIQTLFEFLADKSLLDGLV